MHNFKRRGSIVDAKIRERERVRERESVDIQIFATENHKMVRLKPPPAEQQMLCILRDSTFIIHQSADVVLWFVCL